MRLARQWAAAVVAGSLVALAAPAAASEAPSLSADVVTLPSLGAGPVTSKTWRAAAAGAWLKRIALDVPVAPHLDLRALSALVRTEGLRVGEADVQFTMASDFAASVGAVAVRTGGCPGAAPSTGGRLAWRIELSPNGPDERGCIAIDVDTTRPGRLVLTLDTAATRRGRGVVAVELTLINVETAAGSLFAANPADPVAADTAIAAVLCAGYGDDAACGADGALLGETVRELAGGGTGVTLAASTARAVFGSRVVFSGRVVRGNAPSAGERVVVGPYHRRSGPARSPAAPSDAVRTTTDAAGRFRVAVRVRGTARWSARTSKPAAAGAPRLNTLVVTGERPLFVHAPRPRIEKRAARRLRGGATRAAIVVANPLGRLATLTCRLHVGPRTHTRRFPFTSATLVFRIIGRTGAPVYATVFQDHPAAGSGWITPLIAAGTSRMIRL